MTGKDKYTNPSLMCERSWHGRTPMPTASLTIPREQSTSITARYTHQNCVRVVVPEDGQVMPETCRGFEF
jgi:hypothetical protein